MIWRWAFHKDVTTIYTEPQFRRVPGRYKKKQGGQCKKKKKKIFF